MEERGCPTTKRRVDAPRESGEEWRRWLRRRRADDLHPRNRTGGFAKSNSFLFPKKSLQDDSETLSQTELYGLFSISGRLVVNESVGAQILRALKGLYSYKGELAQNGNPTVRM